MEVINARNVNDAFYAGMSFLRGCPIQKSRAGDVRVAPTPVTTVYHKPVERVLFDEVRDANPFFHIFEALWMLAGRNDADWLDRFVGDFSKRFAEGDGLQHGAYGYRWRYHFVLEWGGDDLMPDQLKTIAGLLRTNPDDRRIVLTMWDPNADLGRNFKDIPCNTHAYFRVRDGHLDITVCCRSNDMIWGGYGANAVHFSILLEYMAARIGVKVGRYYQISNNFHAYNDVFDKLASKVYRRADPYGALDPTYMPLVERADYFDQDLKAFMEWTDKVPLPTAIPAYVNNWFDHTATRMYWAHHLWKTGERSRAYDFVLGTKYMSPDWQLAVSGWFQRRLERAKQKEMAT